MKILSGSVFPSSHAVPADKKEDGCADVLLLALELGREGGQHSHLFREGHWSGSVTEKPAIGAVFIWLPGLQALPRSPFLCRFLNMEQWYP